MSHWFVGDGSLYDFLCCSTDICVFFSSITTGISTLFSTVYPTASISVFRAIDSILTFVCASIKTMFILFSLAMTAANLGVLIFFSM